MKRASCTLQAVEKKRKKVGKAPFHHLLRGFWKKVAFHRGCVRSLYLHAGVLDIAGGSGSLSFCLQTVHGVRCTTVDPRPAKLSKDAHRHLARMRAEAAGAATSSCSSLLDRDAAAESLWGCLEQDVRSTSDDLSGVRLSEGSADPTSRCMPPTPSLHMHALDFQGKR